MQVRRLLAVVSTTVVIVVSFLSSITLAATTTTDYQYDALGRVSVVNYPNAAAQAYCYDAADNRTKKQVVSGTAVAACIAVPPPAAPAVPAPISASCRSVGPGGWVGTWSSVANAHHYQFRNTNEQEFTVTITSINSNSPCKWIKACDANNLCSSKTLF